MSAPIKCPQCAKMMQSHAKVCGFCSYDLVNNAPAASPKKKNLVGCFAIVAVLVLGVLIVGGIRSLVSEVPPPVTAPVQ